MWRAHTSDSGAAFTWVRNGCIPRVRNTYWSGSISEPHRGAKRGRRCGWGCIGHAPGWSVRTTRILVWQWGRRAPGHDLRRVSLPHCVGDPAVAVRLSLSCDAEIMAGPDPPRCEMPVRTLSGYCLVSGRLVTMPLAVPSLMLRLCRDRPDIAICAMPGPLDLVMAAALRLLGVRLLVVVHEAEVHPGDGYPMQMTLQRLLCRCASGLVSLSSHVGTQLKRQNIISSKRKLIALAHPPFALDLRPVRAFLDRPVCCFLAGFCHTRGLIC